MRTRLEQKVRSLKRCALLLFPNESLNPSALDGIVAEGFTDIGLAVFISGTHRQFTGQGFSEEQGRTLAGMAADRGLGIIAFTGYMKYQEDILREEPRRAMVVSSPASGLHTYPWLCPFRPENVERYLELLNRIAEWPALREVHLNDEASLGFSSGEIGCYCDHCQDEFKKTHGEPPPRLPDWDDDLWWAWIQHRMDSWVEIHAKLRAAVKSIRPDVSVGIQHSSLSAGFWDNPWRPGFTLARDAEAMDVVATDPYHYNQMDHFPHRPHRRILTEATRATIGSAAGRLTNIYTQAFSPPGTSIELGRQDGLLEGIVPFALGADTLTPYAYELMKIIPEFFEGLQDARQLIPWLEASKPWHYVTLLLPVQTEIHGYPREPWGRRHLTAWSELMNRVGLPWRWFADERLDDLEELQGPLVVPDAHCLSEDQLQAISDLAGKGTGILWVGNTPRHPWEGSGSCPPPSAMEEGTFTLDLHEEHHPLLRKDRDPVILSTKVDEPGIQGKVLGSLEGRDALVAREDSRSRQVWMAGRPVHSFVRQGNHGSVRSPTGGPDLVRDLIRWLASEEPLFELTPFPPGNAYGKLRPWDRRDQPTMELLPLLGEGLSLALIFHYMHLAYQTALVIRSPEGARPQKVEELWAPTDESPPAQMTDTEVRIPLDVTAHQDLVAMAVHWAQG